MVSLAGKEETVDESRTKQKNRSVLGESVDAQKWRSCFCSDLQQRNERSPESSWRWKRSSCLLWIDRDDVRLLIVDTLHLVSARQSTHPFVQGVFSVLFFSSLKSVWLFLRENIHCLHLCPHQSPQRAPTSSCLSSQRQRPC